RDVAARSPAPRCLARSLRGGSPRLCGDPPARVDTRALESEIRAEPQDVCGDLVRDAGDRVILRAEVEVQIFGLDRPAACQSHFQAGAGGPADRAMAFRNSRQLGLAAAISQAAGAVEQDVVERIAGAPAQGAEPWI